jgi:hypothetical protein
MRIRTLPLIASTALAVSAAPASADEKIHSVEQYLANQRAWANTSVKVHGLTYCPSEAACVLMNGDDPDPARAINYSCSLLPEADRIALFKSGTGAPIRSATVTLRAEEAERIDFDK